MELYRHRMMCGTLAGVLCVAAAWSQTIRIPDLRQRAPVATVKAGDACHACGRVVSIREISIDGRRVVPATYQGAPRGPADQSHTVGAVVYLPLGGASTDRPYIGGVGTPEMKEQFGQTTYEITVRMDDGVMRVSQRREASQFVVGDRVRIPETGELELVIVE